MRIAKSSIPDNVKLQKETVLSLVKGSTVFINYLAATAHDVALSKQHKSISASDVLKALEMLEFTDMVEQLQGELQVYRQLVKTAEKKSEKKKSSNAIAGPVPSTSRKTMQPAIPVDPISPEGATLLQQADHEPVYDVPMDIDGGTDVREEEVGVEDGISEDDPIESDEGESDVLEDKVALEEEELRKDHQGLEEPPTAMALQEDLNGPTI